MSQFQSELTDAGSWTSPAYTPLNKLGATNAGFKTGSSISDMLAGLKNSPLGSLFSSGAGGGNTALGTNSDAYKKLLAMGGQSFSDWWSQVGGQIEGDYAKPLKLLEQISTASNPSGMPVASADILGAPGLRTAESGARDLRTQLMSAGGAGGNRSGLGDLASVLPEQQLIGQAGNVRTQASIGAAEQERERASINSNMKMGALNTWTGAVGQKSAMKAGALQGFTGLQQNALQAAMQALIQLLGIDASQAAKLGITMGPGGTTTSISAPLGAGLAGV